jgi:integrase
LRRGGADCIEVARARRGGVRAHGVGCAGRGQRLRDATLVSGLAYAGLRPGEALALTWAEVGERTILVEKALALGVTKTTKNGAPARSTCSPARLGPARLEDRGRPAGG